MGRMNVRLSHIGLKFPVLMPQKLTAVHRTIRMGPLPKEDVGKVPLLVHKQMHKILG